MSQPALLNRHFVGNPDAFHIGVQRLYQAPIVEPIQREDDQIIDDRTTLEELHKIGHRPVRGLHVFVLISARAVKLLPQQPDQVISKKWRRWTLWIGLK